LNRHRDGEGLANPMKVLGSGTTRSALDVPKEHSGPLAI
jgi:hypothetical protein